MSLEGSTTHQNLMHVFARESQANRRYLWFAEQADVEGYPDIAALFRSIAEGETGHAQGLLEYLLPKRLETKDSPRSRNGSTRWPVRSDLTHSGSKRASKGCSSCLAEHFLMHGQATVR